MIILELAREKRDTNEKEYKTFYIHINNYHYHNDINVIQR